MEDTVLKKSFGKFIAKLRNVRKISQDKFSELSGMQINTISKIERGESDPRLTTLSAFAEGFNMSLSKLFAEYEKVNSNMSPTLKEIIETLSEEDEKTLCNVQKQIEILLAVKYKK